MDKGPEAFRTISEVADELDLPQHVLRFWETRFNQIKPMKRGGGRRYYRPDDIDLLKGIRHLLYDQGYTIKGVQKLLRQNGPRFAIAIGSGEVTATEAIAAFAKSEPVEKTPAPAPARPIDDEEGDQLVGHAKIPAERRAPQQNQASDPNLQLSQDDRSLLQEALYDLLECKRLLDQIR